MGRRVDHLLGGSIERAVQGCGVVLWVQGLDCGEQSEREGRDDVETSETVTVIQSGNTQGRDLDSAVS